MSARISHRILFAIVGLSLSIAPFMTGCCNMREGMPLKWEKIADGDGAGQEFTTRYADMNFAYVGDIPRLIIIDDSTAVSTLQGRVSAGHLELAATTDFSSYWIAVVHQGREEGNYHPITVSDVRLQDDTVTIYAEFHQPTPTKYQTFAAKVSPYYILQIEKPTGRGKMDFALSAGDRIIPQTCAVEGKHLPWEKVVFDQGGATQWNYEEQTPWLVIVTNPVSLSSLENHLLPEHLEMVAGIDFSTYLAVVVYQGMQISTGYSVELIDVRRQENIVVVCAQLHEPREGQAVGASVTSPYYIAKVERPQDLEGELTFILMDNNEEISRQVEIIP